MSVQLVVYPQWHNGVPTGMVIPGVEILSDPDNFNAIGTGINDTAAVANTPQVAVNFIYATMSPNYW